MATRRNSFARERIDTGRDTRFVRRDERGHFSESDDAGRSLRKDREQPAKQKVKSGHGDRGDR